MTNTEKAQAVVDKITSEHRENIALKEQAKSFEQTLKEVREGLVPLPVAGENWRNTANYITGDTVVYLSATYTALKYNKDKSPDVNPDFWEVAETVPSAIAWSDISDGSVITEGTQVTQDGFVWICIMQHLKSTVYKPKDGSTRWTKVS